MDELSLLKHSSPLVIFYGPVADYYFQLLVISTEVEIYLGN